MGTNKKSLSLFSEETLDSVAMSEIVGGDVPNNCNGGNCQDANCGNCGNCSNCSNCTLTCIEN